MKCSTISYSRIKNFNMCPFRYYLESVLKKKMPLGPSVFQGSLMHSVIEEFIKNRDAVKKDYSKQLIEMINKEYEKLNYAFDDEDTVKKTVYDMVSKVFEMNFFSSDFVSTEKFFTVSISDMVINGVADVVRRVDEDTIEIIDWKSSKKKPKYDEQRLDLQPRLYDICLREMYPEYPNVLVSFYYLRHKKPDYLFYYTDEEREETIRSLKQTVRDIRRLRHPERRKTWMCKCFCNPEVCDAEWEKYLKTRKR